MIRSCFESVRLEKKLSVNAMIWSAQLFHCNFFYITYSV